MANDYHSTTCLDNSPNTRHCLYDRNSNQVESTEDTENSQTACRAGGGTYYILEVLCIFK